MNPLPIHLSRILHAPPARGWRRSRPNIPENMRARMADDEARAWSHSAAAGAFWESGMRLAVAIRTAEENNCCAAEKSAVISARGQDRHPAGGIPETKNENTKMKLQYGQNNPHNPTGIKACDYGTITTPDGEIIDLTQQAYINQGGTPTTVFYEAHATSRTRKDADGEPIAYKVFWALKDGAEEIEDESEACDWDDFDLKEI